MIHEKLTTHVNTIFAPYKGIPNVDELKADLLSDLEQRFNELKAEGKDDETALQVTIDSIGNIEETVQELANISHSRERQILTNLSASNLPQSDFTGVVAHNGKFNASMLRGSDFSNADLSGSSFKASDVRDANFDGANLTNCEFSTLDLSGASFQKVIMVGTTFSKSDLDGVRFADIQMTDVDITMCDLRKTVFKQCVLNGVDFKYSDLRGVCLDAQTFIGVKFDGAALNDVSFKGATLKNVSFRSLFALTNRYYRALQTIHFDDAKIDKLTYASLKGLGAELSTVTVI